MNPRFIILISTLFFASCLKDKSKNDTQAPVITWGTPANNAVITPGTKIRVTGLVSDNDLVVEIHIHITDNSSGFLFIDAHENPGLADAAFSNQILSGTAGIDYKIEVIAKDRALNETRSSVFVSCH